VSDPGTAPRLGDMTRPTSFLPLAALVLAIACGDSAEPAAPTTAVAGAYRLQSIDGTALPATIDQDETLAVAVIDETLTLAADGTFRRVATLRVTEHGSASDTPVFSQGRYVTLGTAVTLHYADGMASTGTVSAGAMSVAANGRTFLYRR